MPRRSRSQPDPLATFPEWARRLAERYYTKTVSTFILHGAVRDLQPADDGRGDHRFVPLRTFLSDELFGSRDLVAFYDRSSGIRLATPEMQKDFMAAVAGYDTLFGTEYAKAVPKDPARAFPLLESYARVRIADGMSRVSLDRVLTEAMGGAKLTAERLKEKKKEIIQAEVHGLLEFIEPAYSIDMVSGHAKAKQLLRQAAKAIQTGKRDVAPMGFLIAGPIGTGKTFLATCFAGEIGIPCVKFLNFRSQWQGVTEGNVEKLFNLLKAMWPVAVIVDEADAFLGNRNAQGDSGTSARVFSQIASFMGNTEYRGKIVWFLLTSRPDLLPVDLKRQGRAEEHLALFYPESHDERVELVKTMARKAKVNFEGDLVALLPPDLPKMSGADLEAALVRAKLRAVTDRREKVSADDLRQTFADFLPPSYPLEVELQTLVAIAECTSRELLPESYRQKPREEVTRRIRELKVLLSEQ